MLNNLKNVMAVVLLFVFNSSFAMDFSAQKVTDGVYAYIGPLTDRTPENLGLNNNIGFIDTADGWVLVDSGAGNAAAKKLENAAKSIKDQPIVAVINIGSQDHRWLGNDYFAKQGVKIYAYKGTVKTQTSMFDTLVGRLSSKVPGTENTKMKTADIVLEESQNTLNIGGVEMQLNFYGDAHFPGDAVLYLPAQKVLFTGDVVYVDRMLGVHPWSNTITWNEAYKAMRNLPATYIVPGHGKVSDWAKVDIETGNYLDKLVTNLTEAAENMSGVGQAVSDNADWPEVKHLEHYDSWHKQNLNRTYLRIESTM